MFVAVENPILASEKVVVLSASAHDQISSSYPEKRHGLLTYFFLKGVGGMADSNKNRTVELGELYEYVKLNVETIARKINNIEQAPQILPSLKRLGSRAQLPFMELNR